MIVLGINAFGHDSSAALIVDEVLVYAVEEERLTRKKHDGQFPVKSIQACLDFANITIADVDHVTFFWNPTTTLLHIPVYFFKFFSKVPKLLKEQKQFEVEENLGMLNYIKQMRRLPKTIRSTFKNGENARFKFHYQSHHLCHAASAFYPSGFENAAILTIDGVGEWATASICHGQGNKISILKELRFPHSLGLLYSAVTYYCGFKVNSGEYKLMGLAPYGSHGSAQVARFVEVIKKDLVDIKEDGSIWLNQEYFNYATGLRMVHDDKWEKVLGFKRRESESLLEQIHWRLLARYPVTS